MWSNAWLCATNYATWCYTCYIFHDNVCVKIRSHRKETKCDRCKYNKVGSHCLFNDLVLKFYYPNIVVVSHEPMAIFPDKKAEIYCQAQRFDQHFKVKPTVWPSLKLRPICQRVIVMFYIHMPHRIKTEMSPQLWNKKSHKFMVKINMCHLFELCEWWIVRFKKPLHSRVHKDVDKTFDFLQFSSGAFP